MTEKKVAIVIVNWNGWEDTVECIESISKVEYTRYEVIVVDNASSDNSVNKIKELAGNENLQIIENKENYGFAAGANIGLQRALEDPEVSYFLLLNNDTVVSPAFLSRLVEAMEGNIRAGIAGPKICYYDRPSEVWFERGKIIWPLGRVYHSGSPGEPEYLTGCCMLIGKEVLDRIGFLDPTYFLYYEDADFCLRARKAGYDVVVEPDAVIWHKVNRSTSKVNDFEILYHITRSKFTLMKRHSPPGSFVLFLIISPAIVILSAIIISVKWLRGRLS